MNYTYCEEFKDNVKYQCDNSAMYGFDNGYGAIVEYKEEVDNLWITIIKDIDGHGFNYAYPDFAHGYSRITGVETYHLFLWLRQINGIKGGHEMTNLETLKQQTAAMEAKLKEMKAEIDRLENGWEMKYPFKDDDDTYTLSSDGEVSKDYWTYCDYDKKRFNQGNVFPTKEAGLLEAKRRNLLTRFRAFRDECNEDWKPKWHDNKPKYFLFFNANDKELQIDCLFNYINLHYFGYFEKAKDAERAIELFGDEIKELFVECE